MNYGRPQVFAEFERFLTTVEYKDWRFLLNEEHMAGTIRFTIVVPTLNTRTRTLEPGEVAHSYAISEAVLDTPHYTVWARMIFDFIQQTERHESTEWFHVDGKAIFDPHNEPDRHHQGYVPKLVPVRRERI